MYDFVFGICWYNDPSIIRLLDSLPESVPKIVVDGKFKFLESNQELSSQELRDKVLGYPNVFLVDAPNLLEPEKRQIYLTYLPTKAVFIIDSDEWIYWVDWELFHAELKELDYGIHQIDFVENGKYFSNYPRVWVHPEDWRYVECHNIFENKKTGERLRSSATTGYHFKSVQCSMDDLLRSKEFVERVYQYQKKMIEYEKPLKKQLL